MDLLASLIGFILVTTVLGLAARQRSLRESAEKLRRFSEEDRQRFLAENPDLDLRRALQNLVRDDVALDDQASVARFHFAPGTRRLMSWSLQKAALTAAGCLAIIIVSDGVNPTLNFLFGGLAALNTAIAAARLNRLRQMDASYEISPFNLTEIRADGARRVLSWHQHLVLRDLPRNQRVEVGPEGSREVIRLDYQLLEFYRAVQLVLEYGGFVPQVPPAEETGRTP